MKFIAMLINLFYDLVFGKVKHTFMVDEERLGQETYYRDRYNRRWVIVPGLEGFYRARSPGSVIMNLSDCYIVSLKDCRPMAFGDKETTFCVKDLSKVASEIEARIEVIEYTNILEMRKHIFPNTPVK